MTNIILVGIQKSFNALGCRKPIKVSSNYQNRNIGDIDETKDPREEELVKKSMFFAGAGNIYIEREFRLESGLEITEKWAVLDLFRKSRTVPVE